jgi:hypothetical protein
MVFLALQGLKDFPQFHSNYLARIVGKVMKGPIWTVSSPIHVIGLPQIALRGD